MFCCCVKGRHTLVPEIRKLCELFFFWLVILQVKRKVVSHVVFPSGGCRVYSLDVIGHPLHGIPFILCFFSIRTTSVLNKMVTRTPVIVWLRAN